MNLFENIEAIAKKVSMQSKKRSFLGISLNGMINKYEADRVKNVALVPI